MKNGIKKIFIDGQAGTTGLQIRDRLLGMAGLDLLEIAEADRKNLVVKRALFEQADLVILCLHDEGAKESVGLLEELEQEGKRVPRVIDASTAHRVHLDWAYGFAELDESQKNKIRQAKKVSNPGCYATGAIALLHPLTAGGWLKEDADVFITATSGYSGGGRSMIESFESHVANSFELYGLNLMHKHVAEIMHYGGLKQRPLFVPSVANFPQGMLVQIPIFAKMLTKTLDEVQLRAVYQQHYAACEWIKVMEASGSFRLDAPSMAGRDDLEIYLFSTASQTSQCARFILVARLDNLGKGASGAAVQNVKLMLGL